MDLSKAGQAHNEWKVKFRMAMAKKEQLDATTIAADNKCDLGKWLHGDATKLASLAEYRDCKAKHAAFHAEAGKVAKLINAGKYAEAEAALDAGTPFSKASFDTIGAIGALKKHVA